MWGRVIEEVIACLGLAQIAKDAVCLQRAKRSTGGDGDCRRGKWPNLSAATGCGIPMCVSRYSMHEYK